MMNAFFPAGSTDLTFTVGSQRKRDDGNNDEEPRHIICYQRENVLETFCAAVFWLNYDCQVVPFDEPIVSLNMVQTHIGEEQLEDFDNLLFFRSLYETDNPEADEKRISILYWDSPDHAIHDYIDATGSSFYEDYREPSTGLYYLLNYLEGIPFRRRFGETLAYLKGNQIVMDTYHELGKISRSAYLQIAGETWNMGISHGGVHIMNAGANSKIANMVHLIPPCFSRNKISMAYYYVKIKGVILHCWSVKFRRPISDSEVRLFGKIFGFHLYDRARANNVIDEANIHFWTGCDVLTFDQVVSAFIDEGLLKDDEISDDEISDDEFLGDEF